jgi:succinoglycan biosynthesis protein ExoA
MPRDAVLTDAAPTTATSPSDAFTQAQAAQAAQATDDLVTIVVPARNEEKGIRACLDSILAQDHEALEVIVVDGMSTDSTPAILAEYARRDPRVRVLTNELRVIPVSMNLALAAASAPWLVRVDAHSVVPTDYVRLAMEHLGTGLYGAVGGRKDGVGRSPAGRAIAAVMGSRFGVGGSTYHFGEEVQAVEHVPFGAYPVALLREMGGWDETFLVNEDFELDYRLRLAGHTLLFDPRLRIDWECRQAVGDLYRQYRRYGGGKAATAFKHPASLRGRHLAPPLLVLNLAVAGAVALRRPVLGALLAAPYVAVVAAGTATTVPEVAPGSRRYVAPAFAAMHVGYGIGFWRGAVASLRARLGLAESKRHRSRAEQTLTVSAR